MTRSRVVVAGLGDSGLLTAIHLRRHADVVGISAKPALVSGQELGLRLARPQRWVEDYFVGFDRFRGLDGARVVHGSLVGADLVARTVSVRDADGVEQVEPYDALVISTGVTNGFWRRPDLQTADEVEASLLAAHDRLASASSIAVIGGGAAAVSSAFNAKKVWPDTQVDLYFPGERALVHHHGKVWAKVAKRLTALGVGLHAGHRAVVPDGFGCDEITTGPVGWSTGQEPVAADAVLWTVGRVRPNTGWLPSDVLDDDGFVTVDEHLRVPGHDVVFAIGDVAASDPLRTSARSRADSLVAHNVRAALGDGTLKRFTPAERRWGSVLGVQDNKLEVFAPTGQAFTLPWWRALYPWVVARGIYQGIRPPTR